MTAEGCWKGLGVPGSCGNGKEKQGRGDEQRRGEVGVGFLLTGSGFWWPSRLPRPVVWGWDPGGSGLAFLCLSAPSAAGEASVLAHTKRAGRVGVGESGLGGWALGTAPSRALGGNGAARRAEQMARPRPDNDRRGRRCRRSSGAWGC